MIEVHGLTRRYGANPVLRGVDLSVRRGEIFALLGPNGAGKTTTVRILATLTRPDAGSVEIAGIDALRDPHAVRRRIALTGQYAALDEAQTGRENLRMIARLARLDRRAARARAEELLGRFDLLGAAGRRVGTYSGGMRRRLDLAASLAGRPAVVFLDEPTTGLDPRSRLDLWAVVADLAREGTTVFLTTQYLEEADQLADRIAVVAGGRVVAEGTAAELKARVGGCRLDVVAGSADAFAQLRTRAGARATEVDEADGRLGLAVDDEASAVRRLLDDLDPDGTCIRRFALARASLDDAFLALTGAPTDTPTDTPTEGVLA
jgi:ABC-2 type transport system ATP-binding protein